MVKKKNAKLANIEGKRRRCMMCGELFDSAWIGNRVCKKCRSSAVWKRGY